MNEHKAGAVDYTPVADAQATLLSDRENALSVQRSRRINAATLIGNLSGDWSDAQLHDAQLPETKAQPLSNAAASP